MGACLPLSSEVLRPGVRGSDRADNKGSTGRRLGR